MKVLREIIKVKSPGMRPEFHKVTDQVRDILKRSDIKNGICVVYSHHTTCSVLTQEDSFDVTYNGMDFLHHDLCEVMEKMVPTCRSEGQYKHPGPKATEFAESVGEPKPETLNTGGHLRSIFLGRSETIVVVEGALDLGEFGHVYFVDLDTTRGRDRQVQVQIIGE